MRLPSKGEGAKMVKLEFVDAQEMHKLHPKTFLAPTIRELRSVKVGSFVKICAGRERFWVIVYEINGDNLRGVINNELLCTKEHGLGFESVVHFELKNVYQTLLPIKQKRGC